MLLSLSFISVLRNIKEGCEPACLYTAGIGRCQTCAGPDLEPGLLGQYPAGAYQSVRGAGIGDKSCPPLPAVLWHI